MGIQANVTNAICDGPDCTSVIGMHGARPGQIPEGWYRITIEGDGHRETGLFIFDDLKCIEKWANGRRRALGQIREVRHRREEVPVAADAGAEANDVRVNGHHSSGANVLINRKRQEREENQALVLLAFEGHSELTVGQIAKSIGIADGTARDHVHALVEQSKLRVVRQGTPHASNDPRTYALVD